MSRLDTRGMEIQRPDVTTPTLAYTGECINGIWRFFPSAWSIEAVRAKGRSTEAREERVDG